MVDILVQGNVPTIDEDSFRQSISVETFVAEIDDADVFANIVAGSLRLRLPPDLPFLPWICLAKTATGLTAGGDPPSLKSLASEFGVEAELADRVRGHGANDAVATMWATALVLAAMVRSGCPIRRALLMSQVITPPYTEIPALDDDDAWRYVPDDLLAGLHKCRHELSDGVVARAWREIRRRGDAGHSPNFRVLNWRLPGVEPYGLTETAGEH